MASAAYARSVYYIDCAAGDDAADGLSPRAAWRSAGAVSQREFHPGDTILFRRGTACGGMLAPKGSGSAGAPILLDAWGEGALPKIRADAGAEAALRLFNQEYWTIQHLEFIGGNPHGIFVSGNKGVLHGIHIRNVIVHGVTGEPKNKDSGLIVIGPGAAEQRFDDVLVDGVTAYGTSQWAGILVGGARFGFIPEKLRSTNVTIRNSIVHDVAGDGIVMFEVNQGTIEDSAAWYTGMQKTETIGTPNAIWTWMCRECAVRRSEAFLTDSPGVDGGAFDIDYGDDDNVVEDSYGHDTQGYCIAVFGAGWVTANSVVRGNVCSGNGRSPRLAAAQGAVYLSTWNNGRLKGVRIADNRIFWNPPIAAPPVVNIADFEGTGTFENNVIESAVPQVMRGNASLQLAHNEIRGPRPPAAAVSQTPDRMPALFLRDSQGAPISLDPQGRWRLYAFVGRSGGGVAILASAYRQFHAAGLDALLIAPAGDVEQARNLRWDWNLGDIPLLFDDGSARRSLQLGDQPATLLLNPAGAIVWRHEGLTPPGDLGLALRAWLGNPDYTQLITEP